MRRRRLLKALGASGTVLSIAGCTGETGTGNGGSDETTTTAEETTTESSSETTTESGGEMTTQSGDSEAAATVAVGPDKRLRFEPETVEISVGETVKWTFESPGHNVSAKTGASPKVELPDGAEEFASYEGSNHFAIDEVGSTYSHTFEVPGKYVYVCVPHAGQGMVATVNVKE